MVVFGGGNEGIVDELHVYNTGKCTIVGAQRRSIGSNDSTFVYRFSSSWAYPIVQNQCIFVSRTELNTNRQYALQIVVVANVQEQNEQMNVELQQLQWLEQ